MTGAGPVQAGLVEIRVPHLHGPVHDWFVVPGWLHERLHAEGHEHAHRPVVGDAVQVLPGVRAVPAEPGYWRGDRPAAAVVDEIAGRAGR